MGAAKVIDLDLGGAVLIDDLERPGLHVLLDGRVIKPATDETPEGEQMLAVWSIRLLGIYSRYCEGSVHILDIEDGVARVHGSLVLGGLTDQPLVLREGDERRSGEATLLVGNDLDIGTLVRSNARVGCA